MTPTTGQRDEGMTAPKAQAWVTIIAALAAAAISVITIIKVDKVHTIANSTAAAAVARINELQGKIDNLYEANIKKAEAELAVEQAKDD